MLRGGFSLIIALIYVWLAPNLAAQDDQIPIHDLGERNVGQSYNLKLTGINVDCDSPQDFEFEMESLPWVTTEGPAIIRQLGPGQKKSIPAKLDFQYTPVGVHYGRLTSRCITCGWFIFATCVDRGQDMIFKVSVVDPANPDAPLPQTANPYAGLTVQTQADLPFVTPLHAGFVKRLSSDQQRNLKAARTRLKTAELEGQAAQTALREAQRRKSNCERELAKLRSDMERAIQTANTSRQDAKNSAAAAKTATNALKSYVRDERKALKKVQTTMNDTLAAAKYQSFVETEDGTGTDRYRKAQSQVDRLNDKHIEALKAHTVVKQSLEQRQLAASTLQREAAADKAKAEADARAVEVAKVAFQAKVMECGGIQDTVDTAQDQVDKAKDKARAATLASNAAEINATKASIRQIDRDIEKQIGRCKALRTASERDIKQVLTALEAGEKVGILQADGSRKPSMLKKINDKIWDAAEDMANGKAIIPQGPAPASVADTAEDTLGKVTEIMGHAASALQNAVGGVGISDFHQAELLGGVKALGQAVQSLVAAGKNPNTQWAQRDELLRGDNSKLSQDLRAKGYGRKPEDLARIKETITKIFNNKNYVANLIERQARSAAGCVAKVEKLKQQRDALKAQLSP